MKRRVDIDAMRIIACFLVIFNHLPGYYLYGHANTLHETWIYMTLTMFTRINVPVFFMISGALLLNDRQESYRYVLKKRVARVLGALALFTLVLYFFSILNGQVTWSFQRYIRYLLQGPDEVGGHVYWYLYSYLGFLLMLPILRKITRGMTRGDFIMLLAVHFMYSTFVPLLNFVLVYKGLPKIEIWSFFYMSLRMAIAKGLFYPLIGYYIDKKIDLSNVKPARIAGLCAAALIGIAVSDVCTWYEGTHGKMEYTENYVQLFDYVSAICVFVLFKYICMKHENFSAHPKFAAFITTAGSLTFGIYMISPVFNLMLFSYFEEALKPYVLTIFISLLWCLLSMLAGGLLAFLLKKVPGLRRIL